MGDDAGRVNVGRGCTTIDPNLVGVMAVGAVG